MRFEERVPVDVWGPDTKKYRLGLHWRGLSYTGNTHYEAILPASGARSLERYCKKRNLRFMSKSHFAVRSNGYRRAFFANTKPFFGDLHICAYCGRLTRRDNITVDHIYPVAALEESPSLQKKLARKGYTSVNDPRNLVACCMRCNKKKGTDYGFLWSLRGKLGRSYGLWGIRKLMRIILIAAVIWLIFHFAILPS